MMTSSDVIVLLLAGLAKAQVQVYDDDYSDVTSYHNGDFVVLFVDLPRLNCSCGNNDFGYLDECAYWRRLVDAGRCQCGELGAGDDSRWLDGDYLTVCCGEASGTKDSELAMHILNRSRALEIKLSGCRNVAGFAIVYGLEYLVTDRDYIDLRYDELTTLTSRYRDRHVSFVRGSALAAASVKSFSFVSSHHRADALGADVSAAIRDIAGDSFRASSAPGDDFLMTLIYGDDSAD